MSIRSKWPQVAGAYTPVPGGVGPLTIAMLMVNTIRSAEAPLAMLRVGLTGGLACGKSFVGRTLEQLGCHLIRADDIGHGVLLPGGAAFQPVVDEFGREILDETGAIDRHKLAALVFDDPERLAKLNALVHPAVIRREEELIAAAEERDPGRDRRARGGDPDRDRQLQACSRN